MKKLLIVAVVFGAAFASCQSSKSAKSFSDVDSLSYAIGIDIVNQFGLKAFPAGDSIVNGDIFASAIRDAFNDKGQMTPEDAAAFINEYLQVRMPAKAKAEGEAWLEKVKAENPNIKTTESGLMYEIINPGDESIKATNDADQVMVNYALSLKDGNLIQQNDSITLPPLNGLIKGWIEGLKLVGKGGDIVLWVPSDLGYGATPSGPIPANSALKFEIKVLDVIPAPVAE